MTFNAETDASLPEMPMELDMNLITTDRPDPETLVPANPSLPETSMEHDMTTTASPDQECLVDGGPPKEPTLPETSMELDTTTTARPDPPKEPTLPETSMELDTTTTARPDPETFVHSDLPEEPPAPAPSSSSKPINFNFTSAPQSMTYRRKVQPSLSRSPTPRSDMQKYERAKRLRNQDTNVTETQVEKARLIPQDVLMTRIAIQEKERSIELLKDEASGWLLMIRRDD
jgi:hypothetical protein